MRPRSPLWKKQAGDLEILDPKCLARYRISKLQVGMNALQARVGNLKQLSVFQSFQDLDWKTVALEIEQLDGERRDWESRSDALTLLQSRLRELDQSLEGVNQKLLDLSGRAYARRRSA